ncbi:hypothetical protein NDU88_010723, partial [Pleurodeles waltl]
ELLSSDVSDIPTRFVSGALSPNKTVLCDSCMKMTCKANNDRKAILAVAKLRLRKESKKTWTQSNTQTLSLLGQSCD